jgi:hypothetical protein
MPKFTDSMLIASLPAFSREVLELFSAELAEIRFPDLDVESLREAAGRVRDAQAEVDRLEGELQEAQEGVAQQSAALHACAERALAYARVYAEGKPALSAQIDAIRSQPSSDKESATASRKRGRPRKAQADESSQQNSLDVAAE